MTTSRDDCVTKDAQVPDDEVINTLCEAWTCKGFMILMWTEGRQFDIPDIF